MLVYTSSMEQNKTEPMTHLYVDFQIKVAENENWHAPDMELLRTSIALFAEVMGGNANFKRQLGEVLIERIDTGTSLGLAYKDRIKLSENDQFSTWSLIHELAHVWDAGSQGSKNKPGYYGRKPGVNAYGYFYGDMPSGANWRLNRMKDFAESAAIYCG